MNATPSTISPRHQHGRNRQGQHGVVAIEFAFVFLLGLLPLLLLTLSGVLIFAAKQSLTLAAADGARAALHYNGSAGGNTTAACNAALQDMKWLVEISSSSSSPASVCTGSGFTNGKASVSITTNCTPEASAACVKVITSYDYANSPIILGTGTLYGWFTKDASLTSSAVIQIYNTQGS